MDQIGEEHFPWKGKDYVDDDRVKAIGIYGETMDLFCGKYTKATYKTDVLIAKGVRLKRESFEILTDFFHPNAIPVLDFFDEGKNHGRFVIPRVDASFSAWLKVDGKQLMFDEKGEMTTLFRNMIIELCDLVLKLLAKSIVSVSSVTMEDLYIKISHDGTQKLMFLLTEVKSTQYPAHDVKGTWDSIKKLISSCFTECGVKLSYWGKNFSDFIGQKTFTLEKLKSYPDTWNYKMKGDYLLSLHSANQSKIRSEIKRAGVQWPFCEHVLPELLNQIIEGALKKGYRYNEKDPYDYNQLLRNSYKHFGELPETVKSTLVNPEGLIKQIECWSPDIWKKIYEIIGKP